MTAARSIGRYVLADEIAAGGMATVCFGRVTGAAGFARLVAIKRLLPQYAKDPDFVAMFVDEARLASRIRHPNVVPTLDVVADQGELLVVMEYVPGDTLARALRAIGPGGVVPPAIASAIGIGMLMGLHAAHEARDERGKPLELVHRDVSPQNVLVGEDGAVHLLDFGIARALGRLQTTKEGQLKGKLPYMAPEQLLGQGSDRRLDIYAAAVVLWETLTARQLFRAGSEGETMYRVLHEEVIPPSELAPGVSPELDAVVLRGLARDVSTRYATAEEMARALEAAIPPASMLQLSAWVRGLVGETLIARAALVEKVEREARELETRPPPAADPTTPARLPSFGEETSSLIQPLPSTSSVLPPARRGVPFVGAASLVALVAVAIAGFAWLRGSPRNADTDAPRLGASAVPTPASGPSETPAVAAAPTASSVSPPAPSSSASATTVVGTGGDRGGTKKSSPCANPFFVDAKGIRRVRRECLQ